MKKTSGEIKCLVTICLGVPKCHTTKRDKKATKKKERVVHDNESAPPGLILSLGQGRAAHYKNLKPHVPSLEHWCVPQNTTRTRVSTG